FRMPALPRGCPLLFFLSVYVVLHFPACGAEGRKKKFRCLYRRCLPLPIPNRAVKPARADGTAVTGGRVGRRLSPQRGPPGTPRGSLLFYAPPERRPAGLFGIQPAPCSAVRDQMKDINEPKYFVLGIQY